MKCMCTVFDSMKKIRTEKKIFQLKITQFYDDLDEETQGSYQSNHFLYVFGFEAWNNSDVTN